MDPLRSDPSRKGSVVNVNPVNTRPPSDTPEIRKYKKRFNSEILCAALWGMCELHLPQWVGSVAKCCSANSALSRVLPSGVNLLVGTESGLMLLDRSGQGKVYPLINRRRIQQMDVLEGLNVLVTISGTVHRLCLAAEEIFILAIFNFLAMKMPDNQHTEEITLLCCLIIYLLQAKRTSCGFITYHG